MAVAHDTQPFRTPNANAAGWMKLSHCILGRVFVSLILLLSWAVDVTPAYPHANKSSEGTAGKTQWGKQHRKCSASLHSFQKKTKTFYHNTEQMQV